MNKILLGVLGGALVFSVVLNVWQTMQGGSLFSSSDSKGALIAQLEGQKLYEGEIIQKDAQVMQAKEQLYRAEQRAVDQWIAEQIVAKEAAKAGVTVPELLSKVSQSQPVSATEAEVDALIKQFGSVYSDPSKPGSKINIPREEARKYLLQFKQQNVMRSWLANIKSQYKYQTHLQPPPVTRVTKDLALANRPSYGNPNAKVKVVEFSDFQCPACRAFATDTFKTVREKYKDQALFVYRDFPLPQHKHAFFAAVAAKCAGRQNKFWEYHDKLFAFQDQLTREDLMGYAREFGLNTQTFDACLKDKSVEALVNEDLQEAQQLGINATPTIYVNGEPLRGAVSTEELEAKIEHYLAN